MPPTIDPARLVPRTLDIAGVATAVIDTGAPEASAHAAAHAADAALPLLLLHGSGPGVTATANWRVVAPEFARTRRVVAPDQLGFGGTATGQDRQFGRAAWTEHAIAVMDAVGLDRVDVVGNSMGGAIALSLAAAVPDRVRRVVAMGSVGIQMPLSEGLDDVWGYTPSFENMERIVHLFTDDERLITGDLITMRYEASAVPTIRASWEAMFPAPRQRWLDDLALSQDELKSLRQPTLLIHGRDDRVIPLATSSIPMMNLIPDVELHVFGGCGHWTMIERAPQFVTLVSDFLDR
ncbi:MAG: alpha/beta fold hydrolase [Kineosporiaceae bacterium]|nr:alpha/beta fold hydrolase [Kineosporiaceae bacterium]